MNNNQVNWTTVFSKRMYQLLHRDELSKKKGIKKISEDKFSKIIGVSRPIAHKYISGETPPPAEILCRIAKEFNVSVDWLLGFSNVREVNPDKKAVSIYLHLNGTTIDNILKLTENYKRELNFLLSATDDGLERVLSNIKLMIECRKENYSPNNFDKKVPRDAIQNVMLGNGNAVVPATVAAEYFKNQAAQILLEHLSESLVFRDVDYYGNQMQIDNAENEKYLNKEEVIRKTIPGAE